MNYTIEDLTFDDLVLENQVINVDKDTFLYKALCTSYFPKELPPIFSTSSQFLIGN